MNSFELAKIQFRNKNNIFIVLMITVAICFLFIIRTYESTLNRQYNIEAYNDIYLRSFMVSNSSVDQKEQYEILSNTSHIVSVGNTISFGQPVTIEEFKTDKISGDITLLAVDKKAMPKVIEGKNNIQEGEITCPKYFYPQTLSKSERKYIKRKDVFNTEKLLSSKINGIIYDKSLLQLKLVGLYEPSYNISDVICYTDVNTNKYIANEIEKITGDVSEQGIYITVDNAENVDYVKDVLKNKGFELSSYGILDLEYWNNINLIVTLITKFILVALFVLIFILMEKDFQDNKKNYQLMFYLGHNKKEIEKNYIIASLLKLIFSLVIAILLSLIVIILVHFILYFRPLIISYKIMYDFKSIFLVFGVLILSLSLNLILNKKGFEFYD